MSVIRLAPVNLHGPMKAILHPFLAVVGTVGVSALLSALPLHAGEPVKVFILAGQSNMEGAGRVEGDPKRNEGKGSLSYLVENDAKYEHLKDSSGQWVERDDVSIWFLGRQGKLAPDLAREADRSAPNSDLATWSAKPSTNRCC